MRRLKLLHIAYHAQHAAAVDGSPDHPSDPLHPHVRLISISIPIPIRTLSQTTPIVLCITYYSALEDCDYPPYRPNVPSVGQSIRVSMTCIDHNDDDLSMLDTHMVDMRSLLLIYLSISIYLSLYLSLSRDSVFPGL